MAQKGRGSPKRLDRYSASMAATKKKKKKLLRRKSNSCRRNAAAPIMRRPEKAHARACTRNGQCERKRKRKPPTVMLAKIAKPWVSGARHC